MTISPLTDALMLQGLPGIGPRRFRALVDRHGSPTAALGACEADPAGAPQALRSAMRVRRRCAEKGIAALVYGSAGYPPALHDLPDPPPVLFALGRADLLLGAKSVAVVGSRRATAYGRRVARRLGSSLAGQGRCVVSGMAMGIDSEAHRGALPGPTAAVLGSGVDVPSPPRNRALCGEIARHGVVVSEFAPGVRAEPHHFPRRNRIIAALARDVVIVEASRKSGALITAEIALDLGREVHAVPGPIDRPNSQGANRLIADGAGVILEAAPQAGPLAAQALPQEPEQRELLLALPEAPVTAEEAATLTGRGADEVGPLLTILEIRGYLTPTRDGRVVRTGTRVASAAAAIRAERPGRGSPDGSAGVGSP